MKTFLLYCLGTFFLIFGIPALAQQPVEEWARRYDSKGPTADREAGGNVIAVDAAGNSYVTGTSSNSNTGYSNIFTVKYSPSGEELWTQVFENGTSNWSAAIAVDSSGGVYVTGTSVTGISGGEPTGYAFITIRYNAVTGEQSWVRQYEEQKSFNRAVAIAVDNAGSVYITGTVYISPYIYYTAKEFATIRYDAATGDQIWVSRYDAGNSIERAADIAVDDNGGVYVTGTSGSEAVGYDYVTVRYEATSGDRSWINRYKTKNSYDMVVAIAIDNNGGVYIAGTSTSEDSGYDFLTVRYDVVTGKQSWDKQYNGDNNGAEQAYALAIDHTGGVFVTGTGTDMSGSSDFLTVRYEAATGEQGWVQRYNGPGDSGDFATDIDVDNKGSIFVTGYSRGFTTIQYESTTGTQGWVSNYNPQYYSGTSIAVTKKGGVLVIGTSYGINNGVDTSLDLFTIRYVSESGKEDWVQRYNGIGSQHDDSIAITVDAEGNSYVTGTSINQNTSYGSGTSSIVTIKYSPSGDSIWGQVYDKGMYFNVAQAIAVDNEGGLYVTGYIGREDNRDKFVTIRYDTDTGKQRWEQEYGEDYTNWASSIAVDDAGSVYVTGMSGDGWEDIFNYVTVSYDATTGRQKWASRCKDITAFSSNPSITVDKSDGVYIAGSTKNDTGRDFITIRYNSATGHQSWAARYDGGGDIERVTDIYYDSTSIYVTGISGSEGLPFDYVTIGYEAATGKRRWDNRYAANASIYLDSKIVVDSSKGVYVTGTTSRNDNNINSEYVTLRYDAATGEEKWARLYGAPNSSSNYPSAIALDSAGGLYITGTSWSSYTLSHYSTVKYSALKGEQLWDIQTEGPADAAVDLALDREGNIIVTGYSRGTNTGYDFLTIKYSQGQCPVLADAAIEGNTTAAVSTQGAAYSLTGSNATSFNWRITGSGGSDHTSFTGQGTSSISVDWPATPDVYKLSVNYGADEGCPSSDTTIYVHVFDPEAGFVTGGGWSSSPANLSYEFMQQDTRAHWSLTTKYKKDPENSVQGATRFKLENGSFTFRSTSHEARTLVITGNHAFYRGLGEVTHRVGSGSIVTDPRTFAFLVAATDGGLQGAKEADRLRILIWELNSDGTRGAVVYDNQAACSANLDENAPACQAIDGGNITIHVPYLKADKKNAVLALETENSTQGLTAYPTAFNDRSTLAFVLDEGARYTLELYDLKGALVQQIASGMAQAGQRYEHEVKADGLTRGLYLARLATSDRVHTVKIIVQP